MSDLSFNWYLDKISGLMTISGTGPIPDYFCDDEMPWSHETENIKEIIIEQGITAIGDLAFANCTHLTKVTIPWTVHSIGTCAFSYCSELESIYLPEGLNTLGVRAFEYCSTLKTIYLPVSLANVDLKVFREVHTLSEVYYAGSEQEWNNIHISKVANGNHALLEANIHFGKEQPSEYEGLGVFATVREILKKGGDGQFHIMSPHTHIFQKISRKNGDCTLIIFPNGQTMLIDVANVICEGSIMDMLKETGLTGVDYLAITHPHIDHLGNSLTVASYFYEHGGSIGTYCFSGLEVDNPEAPREAKLTAFLTEKGTNIRRDMQTGDTLQIGDVHIEFLSPDHDKVLAETHTDASSVNGSSLVMKFTFGDFIYLTGGDLYRVHELAILEKYGAKKLQARVLKGNHHGLHTSNTVPWLNAISPEIFIAECEDVGCTAVENRIRGMGAKYHNTGRDGNILVSIDDKGRLVMKTDPLQ